MRTYFSKLLVVLPFVLLFLSACSSDKDKLFSAIEKGDTLTIARIAEKDPDLIRYAKNKNSKTPLEYAADLGQYDVVKVLREKGASYKIDNNKFFMAVKDGDIKEVKRLIALGADISMKDKEGWTLLHWAAGKGQKEIAEYLIIKGADVNSGDKDGQTPLYRAVCKGHKEVAELLISKGTDVNARDNFDQTPLHIAVQNNQPEAVSLLLENGAEVKARDKNGKTPSFYRMLNFSKITELLEKAGDKN